MADSVERTVEGIVERVTFENDASGFRVIKVLVGDPGERLSVVGTFPPVRAGARIRVRGRFERDGKHGDQLRAESMTEIAPTTLLGLERYLGSGLIKGVGETYAKRIVAAFGLDTLRVLDETPERLREVEGLGGKRMEAIARAWRDQRAVREIMVFLQAHGASVALATRIYKRYGARAAQIVASEPYRLAMDVWGVGFRTADRIASGLGIARDSPERMQAGVLQALNELTERGHIYTPRDQLIEHARRILFEPQEPFEEPSVARAIDALLLGGYAASDGDDRWIALSAMHAAEVRVAARLSQLARENVRVLPNVAKAIADFQERARISLASEQRRAVEEAANHSVSVITGGPGVGKSTILRALLDLFDRAGVVTRIAAPTGRAAKRMQEATGRDAVTMHRLLDFDPKRAVFRRDRERPIDAHAIVVDEASMIDLRMADALVEATAIGTRLVFVGDVDQLPSVGAGAVLRDLIDSRTLPCVRLTQIFRQAEKSLIVTNAHRIHRGEEPRSADPSSENADFFVIDRKDPELANKTIVELVASRIPARFGLDPVRDIQVLTPMHRGACGSLALNETLQSVLNPHGAELSRGTRKFRVGDKVMQLRNDYDRDVYNGDVGFVASVDGEESTLVVRFDERDVVYESSDMDELTLAYACTVHKSQGSEYPGVVIPLLTGHFMMLSRNLLYTAVTRGKRLVVLVADPKALSLALMEARRDERRTRLATRLAALLATRELAV